MTINTYAQLDMFSVVQTDAVTVIRVTALLSELEQMAADLAEDELWTAPFARLTDAQLEEMENERPGEHFSTNPFLY
jgi:hypothetical protein